MLTIRVLGELGVETPEGGAAELAAAGRGRSLLAWLALNPGTHSRSDVAARFWPDVLDTSARASLRNALWAIRRAVGDGAAEALVATRDRVGLDEAVVRVDAAVFEEHLAAGRLDEALALAGGELLADVDEEWVFDYRDAHRERLAELFEALAARAEAGGDPAGAVAWSRRGTALDPLAEGPQRALFARMAAAGDRAGAVIAYDRLRQRLLAELGMSPSDETRSLIDALRRQEPAASPPPAPTTRGLPPTELPGRLAQAAATPWVGRQQQLARLRGEFERALRGESAVLMITGEGGIGKTRIAAELARGAQGCAVLYGRCDEGELFPFGPFIEMIGGHLAELPDSELPSVLGEAGPVLARLLPGLRARLDDAPDNPAQDPEIERARLFSAVDVVVTRLAERYPLVCIIDDLHWADEPSLLLGKHMVRATGLGRVLLVGTYRDTELDDRHPLTQALADLERDGPIERIALTGLAGDEVTQLAGAHDQQLDEATLRAIHDETRGNPFFVKQVLRHIEEEGVVDGDQGLALPAGLREVVVRRVSRLPGDADQVLRAAALVGRDFDLEVLEHVLDIPEDHALDALDAAVRGGILVEVEDAPGRYSFVHALLRTTLQEEQSAARRSRLHARIGAAIEALHADRLDHNLEDLARHFAAAGPREADRAVTYAVRAAEQARQRLAYEESARLLSSALDARERAPAPDPGERSRLLCALAGARWKMGENDTARAAYAEAAADARTAGAPEQFARAALGHAGGSFERYGAEDRESAELLRQALELLPDGDSGLRAQVLALLGRVLYYSPAESESARSLVDEAIDMARRLGDDEALAGALLAAQFAYWRPGAVEARLEVAGELLEVAERIGDLPAVAAAHQWRQGPLLQLCRRDEADAARAAHADLAERLHDAELTSQAIGFRATVALLEGRWADAEAAMDSLRGVGEGSRLYTSMYGGEAMTLLAHQLRLGEMLGEFEDLARHSAALPGWRAVVAWAHAQAGHGDLALAEVADLRRDGFAGVPRDANYDPTLVILTQIAWELSDAELAAEVEPLLRPLGELWGIMGVGGSEVGPIAYALGILNLVLGRRDAAAADFDRALDASRAMRARPHEAHSLLGMSKAVQAADPERAGELRDEALAIAAELGGMGRLLRDADAAE